MLYTLQQAVDIVNKSPFAAIEPFNGRDGLWGVAIYTGDKFMFVPGTSFNLAEFNTKTMISCWDLRRSLSWVKWDDRILWDVKSLYGGDKNLVQLARERKDDLSERYIELDAKMVAHARAAKVVKIDLTMSQIAPLDLFKDWIRARVELIYRLGASAQVSSATTPGFQCHEFESRWPFIRALREVELNGIYVDTAFIEAILSGQPDQANYRVLKSMLDLQRDGYVTTLLNPIGGRTGRIRHEGGFNSLGIPHGPARSAITSRHLDGKIVTFDFNAIDYRCIVKAVGGEVAALYDGARDFHERTASFAFKTVTPATREAIKYLSYIYIYGGSEDTLVSKTGWQLSEVQAVLRLLDKKILPVKQFREQLWMQVQEQGFVDIPGGRRVYCQDADSAGKVIGLYAQSYSSWIFEQAFTRVHRFLTDNNKKSCIIFSVHDELVIDCHPDDIDAMDELIPLMESDGYVVKRKMGTTYGEVTG